MKVSIAFFIFAALFAAFYFGFIPVRFLLRFNSGRNGHESTLQNVLHRIGVFGFIRFFCGPFRWFRHRSIAHKMLLVLVFIYTFVFFNPQPAKSNANEVYCPDGYAYKLPDGHYIACEDFDQFHEEQHAGRIRTDLYIGERKAHNANR